MSNKRQNLFNQGGKTDENNYVESRPDDIVDAPQRATAAQLANRNIRPLKSLRKPTGSRLGTSLQAPQSNPFANLNTTPSNSFGASTPAQGQPFAFGGNQSNANPSPAPLSFGSSVPAPAPNTFSFGGNQSAPSTGIFNFGASKLETSQAPVANMFGSAASQQEKPQTPPAPASNPFAFGASQPAPSSTPFQFGQAATTQASSAPSSNLFGLGSIEQETSQVASTAPMFGGFGSNQQGTSQAPPASASTSFTFGQNQLAQPRVSSPFNFGGSTSKSFTFGQQQQDTSPAPAQPSAFNFGFGTVTQDDLNNSTALTTNPTPPLQDAAGVGNKFNFGTTTSQQAAPATTAPSSNLFQVGASIAQDTAQAAPQTTAPSSSIFKLDATSSQDAAQPTPHTSAPSTNFFQFGATTQQEQVKATPQASAPASNLFGFNATSEAQTVAQPSAPASNMFNFGGSANATPQKPAEESPSSGFGSNSLFRASAGPSEGSVSAETPLPKSTAAPLFSWSTTTNAPTAPPNVSNIPEKEAVSFSSSQLFTPKLAAAQDTTPQPSPTPVAAPSFQVPAPAPAAAPSSTDSISSAPQSLEPPKVPKVFVSADWKSVSMTGTLTSLPSELDDSAKQMVEIAAQLSTLNGKFREKINKLPALADWSALTAWHAKESTMLTRQLAALKKQQAGDKGVTGNESTVTKRKAFEDPTTPTKRPRGDDFSTTPLAEPPKNLFNSPTATPSQASSVFSDLLNKNTTPFDKDATGKAAPQTPGLNFSTFTPKAPATEPAKTSVESSAFQLGSSLGSGSANDAKPPATQNSLFSFSAKTSASEPAKPDSQASPFNFAKGSGSDAPKSTLQIPNFGTGSVASKEAPKDTSKATSQVPSFGGSSSGSFLGQFAKGAKTYEELYAEKKKKAMDEDYDSDDETKEEWSARYDKEQAEKKKQDEEKSASAPTFSISNSATSSIDGDAPASKSPFLFPTAPSGASTPGPLNSRGVSPAISVFDSPQVAGTPVNNIFGSLSNQNSSEEKEDESSESEAEESEQAEDEGQETKRKLSDDESGSEETLEESMRRKKQQQTAPPKGSIFDRLTRDPPKSEDNPFSKSASAATTNGTTTPKRFSTFDFGKAAEDAAKSAPPKALTHGGDQTYKEGTPLKFAATTPATEAKGVPAFKFQPASPSPSGGSLFNFGSNTTGASNPFAAKSSSSGAPAVDFSFLNKGATASSGTTPSLLTPNIGQSGASSAAPSVMSSRAATPLSEQETSAQESANEEGGEGSEPQANLDGLTEEEKQTHEVLFTTSPTVAKKQVLKDGDKKWESICRGTIYVLKNKDSGKALVKIRIPGGKDLLNFYIINAPTMLMGKQEKMALVPCIENDKMQKYLFAWNTPKEASDFKDAYMSSRPAS